MLTKKHKMFQDRAYGLLRYKSSNFSHTHTHKCARILCVLLAMINFQ